MPELIAVLGRLQSILRFFFHHSRFFPSFNKSSFLKLITIECLTYWLMAVARLLVYEFI